MASVGSAACSTARPGAPRGSRSWRSTTSPTRRPWRICSSTTPSTGPSARRSSPRATPSSSTAGRSASSPRRTPGALPWRELGVDVVVESTGRFVDRASAGKHLEAGAKKVVITAPATDPDVTVVLGVNEQSLRSREAPRRLERLLHHELPRHRRQGAARSLRRAPRLLHDRPLLHERPAHPGLPAQGPPARPRRRAVDDPHDHRRREGGRARPALAQGEAGRHLDPGPDAERVGRRSHGRARAAGLGRRGQRGVPGRRGRVR